MRHQDRGAQRLDAIRRHQPRANGDDGLHPLWHQAGLPQESLGRVLAGQDWAWPQRPVVRPPGSRLPDTPATTLATRIVDSHRFDLVSYLDTAGGRCIAIDRDGRQDASACDLQVDEQHLASAAMTMATQGQGTAAIYGRTHASVTGLYAIMKNGNGWTGPSTTIRGTRNATSPSSPTPGLWPTSSRPRPPAAHH